MRALSLILTTFCFIAPLVRNGVARSQSSEGSSEQSAVGKSADAAEHDDASVSEPLAAAAGPATPALRLGAYFEAFYQWNFNDPSNGLTNYRGFDNRHNAFTMSNIAVDAQWDYANLVGRLTLQVGHTPSTYYLAEPFSPGTPGANASNAQLWKYVQQAHTGYRFGLGNGLIVSAGIFLSPIGPESMAVYESWNWSRSNLFFGLPFYHTGARASYALSEAWTVTVAGFNGWNSVVDNNKEKSLTAQLTYTTPELALSMLYFGGVERARGAPEGRAWRHLFDAHATWNATRWVSLRAQANTGFEPNEFGVSHWLAGAVYARFRIAGPLFFAVRGDAFQEHGAENQSGRASPIFWPARWVSSATSTLDFRPHDRISFRLEYRHDRAGADMYFGGRVVGDGAGVPFVPNRGSQDTLTLGVTTWL